MSSPLGAKKLRIEVIEGVKIEIRRKEKIFFEEIRYEDD